MSILYKEQLNAVNKVFNNLQQYKFHLLTGEVGSGKTYMGSEIARRYAIENQTVLIISPKQVLTKWKEVLNLIFSHYHQTEYLNYVSVKTQIPNEDLLKTYDLVIYDEVHTIKSKISKFKFLKEEPSHRQHFVGLTGSILDKDISDITNLTNFFSRNGFTYPQYKDLSSDLRNRQRFVRLFVQFYLSTGISREEITKLEINDNQLKVNVHELSVQMTNEESAFYKFAESRMRKIKLPESRQMKLLNECLDRTTRSTTFRFKGLDYFVGERLVHSSSVKNDLLRECLSSINEPTLIYMMNDTLAKSLTSIDKNITYIDVNKNIFNAETLINEELDRGKHVVLNIMNIQTGVDLHSNHIIWYQTPLKLSQDVQGVGRITRLSSSSNEKHVYYLYHNNTKQETLVNQLKLNHQLNNEMLNKKDDEQSEISSNIPFAHLLKEVN